MFLDFDGVLHPATVDPGQVHLNFQQLPLLEFLLREVPSVVVVISSSWRLQRPLSELRGLFSPDIPARIIDRHRARTMSTLSRNCEGITARPK